MSLQFLSMWISNTATTAMMLPIVDAVADAINEKPSNARCEAADSPTGKEKDDSPHESEQEDEFNEEDADLPFNQRTFTSINQAQPIFTKYPYYIQSNKHCSMPSYLF